jgi:hypothetical protein
VGLGFLRDCGEERSPTVKCPAPAPQASLSAGSGHLSAAGKKPAGKPKAVHMQDKEFLMREASPRLKTFRGHACAPCLDICLPRERIRGEGEECFKGEEERENVMRVGRVGPRTNLRQRPNWYGASEGRMGEKSVGDFGKSILFLPDLFISPYGTES